MRKKAYKFLPEDLQVAINTFVEQFYIMEENDLNTIPLEYTENLLKTMAKYPKYNTVLLDLIDILNEGRV